MTIVNTVIEIHDSSVVGISENNGIVIVHFKPANLHKSEDRPAIDAGTGWVQEAKLFFSDATIQGNFPDWPCDLVGGEITINGEQYNNLIPVPLEISGDVEARFICDEIHVVRITGREVLLELIGEPRFVEEFKPRSSSI